MPYKRFVLADITRLSRRYVEEDEVSYRALVRCQGMAIGYAGEPATDRQLSPTTLWRWLRDLGCSVRLQAGLRLLRQKDPDLALHRQIRPVAPRKYRSELRREQLQTARLLLAVANVFQRLFGQVIYPRLRIEDSYYKRPFLSISKVQNTRRVATHTGHWPEIAPFCSLGVPNKTAILLNIWVLSRQWPGDCRLGS